MWGGVKAFQSGASAMPPPLASPMLQKETEGSGSAPALSHDKLTRKGRMPFAWGGEKLTETEENDNVPKEFKLLGEGKNPLRRKREKHRMDKHRPLFTWGRMVNILGGPYIAGQAPTHSSDRRCVQPSSDI